MQKKHKFKYLEKFVVWELRGKKCWFCLEPLRLVETTIDHVIPESVSPQRLVEIRKEYGLPDTFDVNGYENWLPCHNHCNQAKSNKILPCIPSYKYILDNLIQNAHSARRKEVIIRAAATKDKLFGKLLVALEENTITHADLRRWVDVIGAPALPPRDMSEIIILDSGHWVFRKDIAREGTCRCDRNSCVDSDEKVYCYFPCHLPAWVIATGLYWKCYDEVIRCPRCSEMHKRGHVGRAGRCERPYANQESQSD